MTCILALVLMWTIAGLLIATDDDLVYLQFKGGVTVFELASLPMSIEFSLNRLFGIAG